MKEWLPENFTPPRNRVSEIARNAVKRGKARRRNGKIALSCCSFLFVAAFTFMAVQNFHIGRTAVRPYETAAAVPTVPEPLTPLAKGDQGGFDGMVVENPSPALPLPKGEGASSRQSVPADISIEKVDHSVSISWEGKGTFAVYKCDSPKFDACSIMEVVEGNSYLDKEENSGKIVYYRIEPLTKRG